jgi:hypothetical protein
VVTGVQTCALPISVVIHDDVLLARFKSSCRLANQVQPPPMKVKRRQSPKTFGAACSRSIGAAGGDLLNDFALRVME